MALTRAWTSLAGAAAAMVAARTVVAMAETFILDVLGWAGSWIGESEKVCVVCLRKLMIVDGKTKHKT